MTDLPLDAQLIAAVIDRRLLGAARDTALARISADPYWRQVFADAAAVVGDELTGAEWEMFTDTSSHPGNDAEAVGPERVLLFERRPAGPSRVWRWTGLVAATALLAVFVGRGDSEPDRPGIPLPSTVLALGPEIRVTDAMRDGRWTVLRSGGLSVPVAARSARLGVLAVDVTTALRTGAAALAEEKARILELIAANVGSAPAAALLRQAQDSAALRSALAVVRALSDTARFDAGVWLELQLLSLERVPMRGMVTTTRVPISLRELARKDSALAVSVRALDSPARTKMDRAAQLRAALRRVAE